MIWNPLVRAYFHMCEQIETGTLHVTTPDGHKHVFGKGLPEADMTIRDWSFLSAVLWRGDVGLGETYVAGLWDSTNIDALVRMILRNNTLAEKHGPGNMMYRLFALLRDRILRRNSIAGSRRNIHAHYDVGNEFYRLWLDETMTYSSALYGENDDLHGAQLRKYDRLLSIARNGGDRILEIGCGWGGFAEHAARAGCDVTGITVSSAQHGFARQRLGNSARIKLQDYRDTNGKFDAITSIEMIEAVGSAYWPLYFHTLKSRLNSGGRIGLQAIIVEDPYFSEYRDKSDFIRTYTFPGGMLISPQHIEENAQKAGLQVEHIYRFGKDYARTLREWVKRFQASEHQVRKLGHGDRFIRSWNYYLQICAAVFDDNTTTNVAQIELSHG